jgi:hypothetical protein
VTGGTSAQLTEVEITTDLMAAAGCTVNSCYARTVTAATGSSSGTVVPPSVAFLAPIKDAQLPARPEITISNLAQVDAHTVSFDVAASATSPFLFLEVNNAAREEGVSTTGVNGAAAGWFSDNNFLAEKGHVYRLTYTSYSVTTSVETFSAQVQARALQHAYNCALPLTPTIA